MTDKLGRGWLESLRQRVIHEIQLHKAENPIMRRARYSVASKYLRLLLADRSFFWFLGLYGIVVLGLVLAEALTPPDFLPPWSGDVIKGFLKDSAGFLITAQVGILGVVSVAVGLVTLIAQRDDKSSTNTDIRLYYSESLAYDVIASSAALLVILSVELFWPAQFGLHQLGLGSTNLSFKVFLAFIHMIWLCVNVAAFGQFLATSLRFVEPKAREQMRERYTANIVLPDDLQTRLFRHLSSLAPKALISTANEENGPDLTVGYGWTDTGSIELQQIFKQSTILHDIWLVPLRLALQNWWRRTSTLPEAKRNSGPSLANLRLKPEVTLPVAFEGTFEGSKILCRRDGGASFRRWERSLIRFSLRFSAPKRTSLTIPPTPSALLEELADKVIGQIERLAITGFRAALDEMIRYHVFLIGAYNSRDDHGLPISLAEFGGVWESPLQEWIHHYRRVFERAVEKLTTEPSLIETLAHTPNRLLAGEPADVCKYACNIDPLRGGFRVQS